MSTERNLTVTPLEELIARKKRRERRTIKVISSGWKSNALNFSCLITAFLLCFAHFEHLQSDADFKLFEIRNVSVLPQKDFLIGIVYHGHIISAVMFLFQLVAIKLSKTRFTFLGLLSVLSWPAMFFVHYEQIHHRDYLISRLALSAFTLLISTAILFLPKKPNRKKRANTFYSAFSVASTPLSQRSRFTQSQSSSITNFLLDNSKIRMMDVEDETRSLSSKRSLPIGTSATIRNRTFLNKSKKANFNSSGFNRLNSSSHMSPSLHSFSACPSTVPSKSFDWREKRDETPLREVNQLIDDLMLYSTDEDTENESIDQQKKGGIRGTLFRTETSSKNEKMMLSSRAISPGRQHQNGKQQGPFASLTFNPAVRKIASNHSFQFDGCLFDTKTTSASLSRAGSYCSSLSSSNTNSSPFRHL